MKTNQLHFFALFFSGMTITTSSNAQSHLVLSEIGLAPAGGEFIEIYNPTNAAISLDNYYLADNSNYARTPAIIPALDGGDFVSRFPAGSSIPANEVLVVALNGAEFNSTFSFLPDFEIAGATAAPDMLTIAASATATLTNTGEGIVLFFWNGASDLVKDVDMMVVGIPTAANQISPKTGLAIDGPDSDAVTSTYLYDFMSLPPQLSAPGAGYTTKRILLETDFEDPTDGNGITGHDETSEYTRFSWDTIYTAPDPDTSILIKTIAAIKPIASERHVFPNPFFDQVHFSSGYEGQCTLVVYNVMGHKILERNFTNETIWNTEKTGGSLFFYELRTANRIVQSGKIFRQ